MSDTWISVSYRAASLDNVLLKFIPIFFYEGCGRHGGGIAKWTDRIAHNVAADIENEVHVALVTVTMLDAVKNFFHPVTTFPARAALAARFMGIET